MKPRAKLNAQQEIAASHFEGPLFCSACPGSGKTTVIIERTIRLIEKGISPRAILSLTFTNKAANEMKERIAAIMGDDVCEQLYMSTFHALAANVLRKKGGSIGYGSSMTIYDSDDQESFMAQVARQKGLELTAPEISAIVWKFNDLREKMTPEADLKEGFDEPWKGDVALEYLDRLRQIGAVDFTGLLYELVRLFEINKDVLGSLQKRFTFFQIDESQDCNDIQYKIAEMLGQNGNVFMVGDLDQSIYGWRGASKDGIQKFIEKFKAQKLRLPLNYRSTPEIISVAAKLIKCNTNRDDDEFITVNPSGNPVECFCLPTPEKEGQWIAHRIKNMLESGVKPEDIAVIYRLNSMSRAIEAGLVQSGVPYQVIAGYGFYDRKEIRDSLAMLRFLNNPYDGIALGRFINKPKRGIGEGKLGKIESFARENNVTLVDSLRQADLYIGNDALAKHCYEIYKVFSEDYKGKNIGEILKTLVLKLKYDEYLKTDKDTADTFEDRKDNLQELINSAALYSEQRSNDIGSYLNNIALSTTSDKKTEEGVVSLLTMHASKGLEFPVVFLPRLEDGNVPHKRAVMERPDGLEEERRTMYVAQTRAEKVLIHTFAKKSVMKYGKGSVQFVNNIPSRFLKESGLLEKCIEINC